ncbi:hypothetical protein PITC_036120 [Penicillium italicum]|uniref:Uncharacterized protein n=1 Tax=Penicillium italicum TaxID=40296 RepID=A0A0A2LED0_PENIT|nr:hypothetical protein PITC_036120 [Penicillium italicum]
MSYMKKNEDEDQVMIKLDRTSVFQDGVQSTTPPGASMRCTYSMLTR